DEPLSNITLRKSGNKENHETMDVLRCVRPGGGFIPKFPIFSKIEVNGITEEPLFSYLKECLPSNNPLIGEIKKLYWSPIKDSDIRWNFEKFLITADGKPYRRYVMCVYKLQSYIYSRFLYLIKKPYSIYYIYNIKTYIS
uniref:Glutathione peroxidase 9 n=1 Tax=Astyanax mexicanus TaxID=7994 RepID=A0A8B9HTN8_ASTMX